MDLVKVTIISLNFGTLIFSFPGNIFIIVMNVLDFFKNRRLLLNDHLILGYSSFSLLYGLHKGYTLYKPLFQLPINEYDKKVAHVFIYLNLCTLWFSTLLSIHFCLKIVSIHHRFYIGLQRTFPKLFPWIIITFLLGCFFLSLYSALEGNREILQNATSQVVSMKESPRRSWSLLISMIICGLCSLLCSVSALTIIISLLTHVKKLQENREGSGSPNMDAHIRAVKTVTTLLAANILIFTSLFVLTLSTTNLAYVFSILVSICHIFSSYFLIKGTKKLDNTLEDMMTRCSLFMGHIQ